MTAPHDTPRPAPLGGATLDDLEELSRINNEFANAQREVARLNAALTAKNRELEVLAAARAETARALAARNEDLQAFAYSISHDLKAPLRGAAGYAAELERQHATGLAERARFCVSQILGATRNLDDMIEVLLEYARLDPERAPRVEVDVAAVVERSLASLRGALDAHAVELTVAVPSLIVRSWDRGLQQVLTNLVDNAIKYSRDARPPRLAIRAVARPGAVVVSVSDNGIGFDMQDHDRLFALFTRLVPAGQYEGTGAGLAIARRLVDKLGGRLHAESAPAAGATFFLELPVEPDRAAR